MANTYTAVAAEKCPEVDEMNDFTSEPQTTHSLKRNKNTMD